VVVIATSKGLIKIVPEGKKSQLPAVIFALLFPTMMLFVSAIASYNLLELKNYWLPFLGMMLTFGILLLAAGLKKQCRCNSPRNYYLNSCFSWIWCRAYYKNQLPVG